MSNVRLYGRWINAFAGNAPNLPSEMVVSGRIRMTLGAPEGRRMRTWVPGRIRSPVGGAGAAIVVTLGGGWGGGEEVVESGKKIGRRGVQILFFVCSVCQEIYPVQRGGARQVPGGSD